MSTNPIIFLENCKPKASIANTLELSNYVIFENIP